MSTQVFIESADFIEGTVDRDGREVEVVLIRPGWSANGRYYSRDVLAKAAGLFENVKAFADHPTRDQIRRGEGRSVKDVTGRYYNVTIGAGGELRARRKVYENEAGNAVWPVIMDSIENRTPYIGLSINAVGQAAKGSAEGRDGVIVEEIVAANSVDDVTAPAAGGAFESLIAGVDDLTADLLAAVSYEEWLTARPDFVESLKKQQKRERQTEAVRAAKADAKAKARQIADLHEQLERITSERDAAREEASRAAQRVALEQAFRRANLPAKIEKGLRADIEHAPPGDWLAIVERAREMAAAVGANRPTVTGAARRVSTPPATQQRPRSMTPDIMEQVQTPDDLMRILKQLGG